MLNFQHIPCLNSSQLRFWRFSHLLVQAFLVGSILIKSLRNLILRTDKASCSFHLHWPRSSVPRARVPSTCISVPTISVSFWSRSVGTAPQDPFSEILVLVALRLPFLPGLVDASYLFFWVTFWSLFALSAFSYQWNPFPELKSLCLIYPVGFCHSD